jgi:3-oxoacyl-[acyl-carrier protein] reductase
MLLENKTVVIYGAAGPVGSAVARACAREGAHVYLAGRTVSGLERVAEAIRSSGGRADAAPLDVLDRAAVEQHARAIVGQHGGIDACFNATGNDDYQGTPLQDMAFDDFLRPVTKAVTAHFIIATTVGRHMARRGTGVILCMAGGREAIPRLGGAHVAWAALAGLCRQLAADLGGHGVRVAWLLSPGSPDPGSPDPGSPDAGQPAAGGLVPNHRPSYDEVGAVAAFHASDWARTMTATEINITGGAVVD